MLLISVVVVLLRGAYVGHIVHNRRNLDTMGELRTSLGQAKGLGSSKSGHGHWWQQRISAIALTPLVFWMVWVAASLPNMSYKQVLAWLEQPIDALLAILLILVSGWHMFLGLRVIIEDYVSCRWLRIGTIIVTLFGTVFVVGGGLFAVVYILLLGL